ncbi:MAG: hypothetical protein OXD33_12250 [Rhodobacteraceae bacterium]|nr:hypothetical protein [Paracoccaceae bacterium]
MKWLGAFNWTAITSLMGVIGVVFLFSNRIDRKFEIFQQEAAKDRRALQASLDQLETDLQESNERLNREILRLLDRPIRLESDLGMGSN